MAKLISETVKLISADPKSHLLGNFRQLLYDLHWNLEEDLIIKEALSLTSFH